ncbi:MAG TPA: hypothetical protein VGV61_03185, partial [Thermoanaerobaculia bacterium]|nr:hypothetical protein [Thermoanaerobaculia bacterium]
MAEAPAPGAASPSRRFELAVQVNRALVFALATVVAAAFRAAQLVSSSWLQIFAIGGTATLSAVGGWLLVRRGWHRWPGLPFDAVWILLDIFFISATVYVTGGASSPWFPWYLATISGAALVRGQLAAFLTFIACTGGYLLALDAAGELVGGRPALRALALMVSLYAAAFFFLRGAVQLQSRRREVSAMRDEGGRKVEELTRLTGVLEERTRELGEANLRLRESGRLKSQFLANVSHELRTPLN